MIYVVFYCILSYIRPTPRITRPNIEASLDNDGERSSVLVKRIDDISIRLWSLASRRARKRLVNEINNSKNTDQVDIPEELHAETKQSRLLAATKLGHRVVKLTESREHYSRYRHLGGGRFTDKQKAENAFLVAADQTRQLAEAIYGTNFNDDEIAESLMVSAWNNEGVTLGELSTAQQAGVILLGAIEHLKPQETPGLVAT